VREKGLKREIGSETKGKEREMLRGEIEIETESGGFKMERKRF
jgi:hypothetical protein